MRRTPRTGSGGSPPSTARSTALALAAAAAILVLLIGVPTLLLTIGAGPLPAALTSWPRVRSMLTSPDDGTLLLALIRVLAWLAWAVLAGSVLLEIAARLRGIPVPRLPALALPQGLARALVSAAAALFLATQPAAAGVVAGVPLIGAGTHTSAPPLAAAPTPQTTTTTTTTTKQLGDEPAPAVPPATEVDPHWAPTSAHQALPDEQPRTVEHVVRRGETLWSIAEQRLGDGARFAEIADLNYGRRQPDGDTLTDTHWITPGWRLLVPVPANEAGVDGEGPADGEREDSRRGSSDATPPADRTGTDGSVEHVVVEGETLWGIAESTLGDGAAWRSVFEASTDRRQPDGARLTRPELLRPGWTVTVPGAQPAEDARTGGAAEQQGSPDDSLDPAWGVPPSLPPHENARAELPRAASADPSPTTAAPATTAPATTAPIRLEAVEAVEGPGDDLDDTSAWSNRTAGGVGALLAAGLIALVETRRRLRNLRRRPGQVARPVISAPSVSATDRALRAVADPLGVHTVDLVLRTLARHCTDTGNPLPTLRAVRLTRQCVELFLAEPRALPAPWTAPVGTLPGSPDGTVWRLEPDEAPILDPAELADIPAPYPALVTLGHDLDDDAHVLVDLEHLGCLGLTGPAESTRSAAAAMILELATSAWADDVQLTVVGDFATLEDVLGTGRIRYLPTVEPAVAELERRSAQDRAALGSAGLDGVRAARGRGSAPQTWTPEVLLVAAPLGADQADRLARAVATSPRTAHAVVTLGRALGPWTLQLGADDDPAELEPTGIRLRPQRLDEATRRDVLHLVAAVDPELPADDGPDPRSPEPALADLAAISPITTAPAPATPSPTQAPPLGATDHPVVRVLGSVQVDGARGSVETSKRSRLTELIAFLALNPGAGHREIDEALWPGRRHEDNLNTRNTATSKARAWLGRNDAGEDYLPRHSAGAGYRLSPAVRSDWEQWLELLSGGVLTAGTDQLETALGLVRGRPFDGVHPRRYAWADALRQEMATQIVDAAYELARRRLLEGRWQAAEAALLTGLAVEPAWEPLWRLRIMAAYEARNLDAVRDAVARLLAVTDALGTDLEPETLTLLDAVRGPQNPTRSALRAGLRAELRA